MLAKLQLSGGMHDRIRVVDVELSPASSFHPFYSWTSRGPGSCGSPEGKGRIGECFKLKLHQYTLYDFPTVLSIMTNNILSLYTIPVNAVINAGRLIIARISSNQYMVYIWFKRSNPILHSHPSFCKNKKRRDAFVICLICTMSLSICHSLVDSFVALSVICHRNCKLSQF